MPTCPNGHQSAADDWCEVCGHRMTGAPGTSGGPVPPPPPPPPAAGGYGYPSQVPQPPPAQGQPPVPGHYPPGPDQSTGQPEFCPQCGTPREAQAHFCEECRYNFLTGVPTPYPTPGPPPGGYQNTGAAPLEYTNSGRSRMNRPAEPIPQQPVGGETDWNLAPPTTGPQGAYAQQGEQSQHAPYPGNGQQGPAYPNAPEQSYAPGGPGPAGGYGYPAQPPQPYPGGQDGQGVTNQQYPGAPEQSYAQGQQPPAPYPPQGGQQYAYPPQQSTSAPQQPQYAQQPAYPQQGGHQGSWRVTVSQDPEYFNAMMERSGPEGAGLQIPGYGQEQQLPLSGQQITIGRRRQSTGESPDIDLSRTPEDPGVSHQHAMLVQQPGGSWAVVDQDSTNGTTLNGAEDPIQPFVPIPLQEGDRVHVGAWTTITLYRA